MTMKLGFGAVLVACLLAGCGSTITIDDGGTGAGGGTASNTATSGTSTSQDPEGAACSAYDIDVVGTFDDKSGVDGTNPPSSASFVFNPDGHWFGGEYGKDPSATKFMDGSYTVEGDVVRLKGAGMGPHAALTRRRRIRSRSTRAARR